MSSAKIEVFLYIPLLGSYIRTGIVYTCLFCKHAHSVIFENPVSVTVREKDVLRVYYVLHFNSLYVHYCVHHLHKLPYLYADKKNDGKRRCCVGT